MQDSIILENFNSEKLQNLVENAVKKALGEITLNKENRYITRQEASEKLHVSLPSIDKAIKSGKLIAYRINGRILIKEDEIELSVIQKGRK